MKAMFMADLLTARKYLLSQAIIGIFVSLVIAIGMQNLYVIVPCVGCMVPFSIGFTLMAFDERSNWQQFRLALPISRASVQIGRYASLLVITLGGIAAGLLATALTAAAASALPQFAPLSTLLDGFDWKLGSLALVVVSLALMLLVLSITLPIVARMGMTKAVRIIPILIVVAIPVGTSLGAEGPAAAIMADLSAWLQTDMGFIAAIVIVLCVTLALYALSCLLAIKFYKTREL